MKTTTIMPASVASSILCDFSRLAREILKEEIPYMKPVMIKGMSRIWLVIKACFMYIPFAMNMLDPMWTAPITMKNRIETFFIFLTVSIGMDYTESCEYGEGGFTGGKLRIFFNRLALTG